MERKNILTHEIGIHPRHAYLFVWFFISNGALSSRILSVSSELTKDSFTSAGRTSSEDRPNTRTTLKLPKVSLMFHVMSAEVLYAPLSFLFQYYTHIQNTSLQMKNTPSLSLCRQIY